MTLRKQLTLRITGLGAVVAYLVLVISFDVSWRWLWPLTVYAGWTAGYLAANR